MYLINRENYYFVPRKRPLSFIPFLLSEFFFILFFAALAVLSEDIKIIELFFGLLAAFSSFFPTILYIAMGEGRAVRKEKLLQNGDKVVATVTAIRPIPQTRSSKKKPYEIMCKDENGNTYSVDAFEDQELNFEIGGPIDIYFEKGNPKVYFIDTSHSYNTYNAKRQENKQYENNVYKNVYRKKEKDVVLSAILLILIIAFSLMILFIFFGIIALLSFERPSVENGFDFMYAVLGIFAVTLNIFLFVVIKKYHQIRQTMRDAKLIRNYIINVTTPCSIWKMSHALRIDQSTLLNKIDRLIDRGYLPDMYINYSNLTLISTRDLDHNKAELDYLSGLHDKSYVCSKCGGTSFLRRGEAFVCEFCGSELER